MLFIRARFTEQEGRLVALVHFNTEELEAKFDEWRGEWETKKEEWRRDFFAPSGFIFSFVSEIYN